MNSQFSKALRLTAGLALSTLLGLALTHAADKKDSGKDSVIKQVMKKSHKGDDCVAKKIGKGQGTKEEIEALLADYKKISKETPPRGEMASWKEKTGALVTATEALSKDPSALPQFKKAQNCKACHMEHKPE
jgi:hypothetical protein